MSATEKERTGWTTSSELAFIDYLAGASQARQKLRGYLDGCARRAEWGAIDPNQTIPHAQAALTRAEKAAEFVRGWLDREGAPV